MPNVVRLVGSFAVLASVGLGALMVQCTNRRDDDAIDPAAVYAKDGTACAQDSECRDGGACFHGMCVGPPCSCGTESVNKVIGIPGFDGTKKYVCRGPCAPDWECGVPVGFLPEADAGVSIVNRCMPPCTAAYPDDAAAGCPAGFVCRVTSKAGRSSFEPACVLAPPTVTIDGPPGPLPEETKVTLTARDTSTHGRVAEYRWTQNSGGGLEVGGQTMTFEILADTVSFQASVFVRSELGVLGVGNYSVPVCKPAGRSCAGYAETDDPCCPDAPCRPDDAGSRSCTASP
ncbi:MAG: hypothetical protein KIT84_32080 [Labilithrix sp.]|nr:hypothetical protein [Labilithrix sp.]MCW5815711.1 hypothetical protein [Labilithrix sp.]